LIAETDVGEPAIFNEEGNLKWKDIRTIKSK
jgi:hypothetical protein